MLPPAAPLYLPAIPKAAGGWTKPEFRRLRSRKAPGGHNPHLAASQPHGLLRSIPSLVTASHLTASDPTRPRVSCLHLCLLFAQQLLPGLLPAAPQMSGERSGSMSAARPGHGLPSQTPHSPCAGESPAINSVTTGGRECTLTPKRCLNPQPQEPFLRTFQNAISYSQSLQWFPKYSQGTKSNL